MRRPLLNLLPIALAATLMVPLAVTLAASPGAASTPAGPAGTSRTAVTAPPVNADWDYQIGGVRRPAARVEVVSRDRKARPAPGRYNICYVNGFQAQPEEARFWRKHWWLVLKQGGEPVVDEGWNEWLLDTGTRKKRRALARIVGRWAAGCAERGYDAVEYDNLDSFGRSRGLLTGRDNKAFARLIVTRAHNHGLAVAQKNWAELGAAGPRIGFDFVISEECGRYRECGAYARPHHRRVLDVEYSRRAFRWACSHWGSRISVVLRDLAVSEDGIRRWC